MQSLFLVQKLNTWLIVGFISVISFSTFAQKEPSPISGKDYMRLLDSLDRAHDQKDFRALVNRTFRQLRENWAKDSIEVGYQTFLKVSQNHFGTNHRITALILHQSGIYQYLEDNLDTALVLLEKGIHLREKILPKHHSELGHSHYLLGRTHYYLDNNDLAIQSFKKSFEIYEIQQNCAMVVNSLRMLGDTYDYLEEQELAEAYYDLVLMNARSCFDQDDPALGNLYLYAANVFTNNLEEKNKALDYYKKAQLIFERGNHQNRPNYASALISQGGIYIDLSRYQEAQKALDRAISLKEKFKSETELDVIYEYLALVARRQKDYKTALFYLEKVREIRSEDYDLVSEEMNIVFHNFGEVYQEQGDFQKAAAYFQKALQAADRNFDPKGLKDNPDLEKLDLTISYTDFIKDLDFKGQLFLAWYQKEGKLSYLQTALSTYQKAIELTDLKRSDLISDGSKLFWQEEQFPVFDRALKVAFTYYEQKKTADTKNLIFAWMEQSKSLLLLESLAAQQKEKSYVGKDSLLYQIDLLTNRVSKLQRQLIEKGTSEVLEKDLLETQIDFWESQKSLKERPTGFSAETLVSEKMEINEFQVEIDDGESVFVEFFVGQEEVYALFFNRHESYISSTKISTIPQATKTLRTLLSSPNQSPEAFETYQKEAYALYDQLLSWGLAQFDGSVFELTIIPDGILAALPFEVLLKESKNGKVVNYSPEELPYLINQYSINYAFSIATLVQQSNGQKQQSRYPYVGFAPEFNASVSAAPNRKCNQGSLAPLLANVQEVESIQKLLSGKIFRGAAATKAAFLEEGMKAKILHLATHACVDDQDPARSKIFFGDDHLYAHELYQLQLQAQMVVLSACETGVGVFQRGEGVMSLARGFAQSGAPSLTLSYWSVSDQSTAQLMNHYYASLANGYQKHDALQEAKLNYLRNQEQLNRLHPYYWSGFVHFGNTDPVELNSSKHSIWPFVWIVLGLLALLITLFLSRKKSA